jgi:hypothetical protein
MGDDSCYKGSMDELEAIVRQMWHAVEGDAWHGAALLEILVDVHVATAMARPIRSAHSIWEIVLHLASTQDLMLRRLRGDATPLTDEEDWPQIVKANEDAWLATVDAFFAGEKHLRDEIVEFPEERLDEPLIEGGSSAYNNFHGYVQHVLYHAGQMALLRRAAREERPG